MVQYKRHTRAITTITPHRISLVGSGVDLPSFYENYEGSVISSAINQYVYVTVRQQSALFDEAYRLSYPKTEHVNNLVDLEIVIARECLRLVHVDSPLYIVTAADLPTLICSDRESVQAKLKQAEIPAAIHYPVSLNEQIVCKHLCCPDCTPISSRLAKQVLSLPMSTDLSTKDQENIAMVLTN